MQERRVVVTGLGTVNPLANNVKETWEAALNGKSGIERITNFDPATFSSQVGGQVKNFDFKKYYNEKTFGKAKKLDSFVHYSVAATQEAVKASGIDPSSVPEKTGICVGSGIGGIHTNEVNISRMALKGHRRISPFYIPAFIGNIASGFISMMYGITGPNYSIQSACATGNHAIASAIMLIKSGQADVMLAGGTEAAITQSAVAGFANMKALSTKYNQTPHQASRPYDRDRDGFVIAGGAATLIIEDYEHARKRGADILCEIKSVGLSGDAYDLVIPHPKGDGALLAMQNAVRQAGINTEQIAYINSHGTATPLGDKAEAAAIYKLIKGNEQGLHVSSTKSMTGHLLGATAALEAVFTILAVKENKIPPNTNIFNMDEEIVLNCINTQTVETKVETALSNSFGFGGHNSCLCVSKV